MTITIGHDGSETSHYSSPSGIDYGIISDEIKRGSLKDALAPTALHAISRKCGTLISVVVLPRRIILDSQSVQTATSLIYE